MNMSRESDWLDGASRAKAWVGGTAATVLLSLMAAFVLVVSAGVRQGDQRRLERSAHDDATWRCKAVRNRPAGADCPPQHPPLTAGPGLSTTR